MSDAMRPASDTVRTRGQRSLGLQLILLLGLVSALGDITYESARSISGPYLALLGAGAAAVGLVSGLGEFIGYALRLVTGYATDRTRAYWWMTFIGYGALLAVPLLAFAGSWQAAAALLVIERLGKALRTPARDVILSHATHQTGRGWGFAVHEALDQVGAIIGPLLFTAVFLARGGYRAGFSMLWIPAVLALVALAVARIRVPAPERLELASPGTPGQSAGNTKLPRLFWLYAAFTFLSVAGFANFQLISYHVLALGVLPVAQIPLLYAAAMGLDALMALAVGKAYDRRGLGSLVAIPFASALIPLLVFTASPALLVAGMVLWGGVMAMHETTMRAAIADIVPAQRRGSAYGLFNAIYGAAWFAGSVTMGALYGVSPKYLVLFAVAIEVVAVPAFVLLRRAARPEPCSGAVG